MRVRDIKLLDLRCEISQEVKLVRCCSPPCTLALRFSKYLAYIVGGSGADGWRSIGPLDAKSRRLSCLHSNHLVSQCPDSENTIFYHPLVAEQGPEGSAWPSTQQNC